MAQFLMFLLLQVDLELEALSNGLIHIEDQLGRAVVPVNVAVLEHLLLSRLDVDRSTGLQPPPTILGHLFEHNCLSQNAAATH